MKAARLAAAAAGAGILFAVGTGEALAQGEREVTQAEAEAAARSIAHFCKTLVDRIDSIISDQWATQDLQDLASVWQDLNCHQVFGVDERVRLLVR